MRGWGIFYCLVVCVDVFLLGLDRFLVVVLDIGLDVGWVIGSFYYEVVCFFYMLV